MNSNFLDITNNNYIESFENSSNNNLKFDEILISSNDKLNVFKKIPTNTEVKFFNEYFSKLSVPFYLKFNGYGLNNVIYKRLTKIKEGENFFRLLHYDWFDGKNNNRKIDNKLIPNELNKDFEIYDNINHAVEKRIKKIKIVNNGHLEILEIQVWINGINVAQNTGTSADATGAHANSEAVSKNAYNNSIVHGNDIHQRWKKVYFSKNVDGSFYTLNLDKAYSFKDLESVIVYNVKWSDDIRFAQSYTVLLDENDIEITDRISNNNGNKAYHYYKYKGPSHDKNTNQSDAPSTEKMLNDNVQKLIIKNFSLNHKWKYCNYNDPGVGFPRDCGKNKLVGGRWMSFYPNNKSHRNDNDPWSWKLINVTDQCQSTKLGCDGIGKNTRLNSKGEGSIITAASANCVKSKLGCCFDGKTTRDDIIGSNCPKYCENTILGCAADGKTTRLNFKGEGTPISSDFQIGGNSINCFQSKLGCCSDGKTTRDDIIGSNCSYDINNFTNPDKLSNLINTEMKTGIFDDDGLKELARKKLKYVNEGQINHAHDIVKKNFILNNDCDKILEEYRKKHTDANYLNLGLFMDRITSKLNIKNNCPSINYVLANADYLYNYMKTEMKTGIFDDDGLQELAQQKLKLKGTSIKIPEHKKVKKNFILNNDCEKILEEYKKIPINRRPNNNFNAFMNSLTNELNIKNKCDEKITQDSSSQSTASTTTPAPTPAPAPAPSSSSSSNITLSLSFGFLCLIIIGLAIYYYKNYNKSNKE